MAQQVRALATQHNGLSLTLTTAQKKRSGSSALHKCPVTHTTQALNNVIKTSETGKQLRPLAVLSKEPEFSHMHDNLQLSVLSSSLCG